MGNCNGFKGKADVQPGQFSLSSTAPGFEARSFRPRYALAGQHHVFKFVDEGLVRPTSEPSKQFIRDLEAIDIDLVNEIYASSVQEERRWKSLHPLGDVVRGDLIEPDNAEALQRQYTAYDAMHRGTVAVVVVATEAGIGELQLGPVTENTVWQHLLNKLYRVRELAAAAVSSVSSLVQPQQIVMPVYIVTSLQSHDTTLAYFEANRYFGLESSVIFVKQSCSLPCLSATGKIVLKTSTQLHAAPVGDGALFQALHSEGAIEDMLERGVTSVQVVPLANLLAAPVEPAFIGLCIERSVELGVLVTRKTGSSDTAVKPLARTELGELIALEPHEAAHEIELGSLGTFFYSVDFLQHKCSPRVLPKRLHVVHIELMPADSETGLAGEMVPPRFGVTAPTSIPGMRLERRLGDVMSSAESIVLMQVDRTESVCLLSSLADSDMEVKSKLSEIAIERLRRAGATVKGESGRDGLCEISGRVSFQGEGLQTVQGRTFHLPLFVATPEETLTVENCEIVVLEASTAIGKKQRPVKPFMPQGHNLTAGCVRLCNC